MQAKIYLTAWCPYCVKAKRFLASKGISFEEIDMTEDPDLISEMKKKTGHQSVPMIFIGDYFVGGCDDLLALDKQGKLDSLLKK